MPLFKTFLGLPTTPSPQYDWSKTVFATSADIALGSSYADWVSDRLINKKLPTPPLSQCRSSVRAAGLTLGLGAPQASGVLPAQQAFINALSNQVSQFLSTQLDGAFATVIYPSGFNYGITYGSNGYYNKATLQDIDTLLGTNSSGQLDLSGAGFSNLYLQIMQAVTFTFSQADTKRMNDQDTAASAQIASILTEFTNAGGTFTSPLPLGGKLQDVFNQLTKAYGSLNNIPDTLNALRNAVAQYKAMAADSYALHNRWYAATARIAAAVANTISPSTANGGQQVDTNAFYAGYTPNKLPTANQLIGSLQTASNKVSLQLKLSSFNSTSSNLSISGGIGFNFPIASIIGVSFNGQSSYDLSRYTSSSSDVTMDINYPGVTLFASTPSVLSSDNSTGWYANDILHEVAAKTGQDATGYVLQGTEFSISELFGSGKVFSRLKTFVISQQPTITLTFTGANASAITSDFKVSASAKVELLGLFTLGSAAASYQVQNVATDSNTGTVTVTLGPPQVSGTIPLQQQVAYVLGGVASYPPDHV